MTNKLFCNISTTNDSTLSQDASVTYKMHNQTQLATFVYKYQFVSGGI